MFFLEGKRCGLRPLSQEDVKGGYGKWFNDAEVCRYNSHHKWAMTEGELKKFIEEISEDKTSMVMAVIDKETKTHIGNISLQKMDYISRQTEIALLFGEKAFWGKGYATEASGLLINHAFLELGMNRVYFGTAENNLGMQRIGEKLGFSRGGIRRQAIYNGGKFYDIWDYDILRSEWHL